MVSMTKTIALNKYRVQALKPNHFLVTLPFVWIKANNLAKGKLVIIEMLSDGSLKILPEELLKKEIKNENTAGGNEHE